MCSLCGFQADEFQRWSSCDEARDELFAITWTLPRPPFIHQLATDAYSAQHLRSEMSPVSKLFPLMGLYMASELGASGLEIQLAHMHKSTDFDRKNWPNLEVRPNSFQMNVGHVLQREPDEAIQEWVRLTWESFASVHKSVCQFCK